ncbi:transposase [Massilia sp. TWP1-3-3]|uniref:transposase n=1 Tax=Massilia sp. TWP1-3-3 TaxID=2804573 RepID=UPI003CFB4939
MSRYRRPVFANVPLHIVQRGNNRNPCFFCKGDYQVFLGMMEDALAEFDCTLHAYVLMPNHVHLLASPVDTTAPASLMQRVGQRYTQYVNRRYRRYGTLWQGRYHSSLVDNEGYFLTCQRYIELNPVRAGIVAHPVDYDWSSYRVHAHGEPSDIVVPHDLYHAIDAEKRARESSYRALFAQALPEPLLDQVRQATQSNGIYGSAQFSEQISVALGRDFSRQTAGRRPF